MPVPMNISWKHMLEAVVAAAGSSGQPSIAPLTVITQAVIASLSVHASEERHVP
jgi:hypothetical protein